MDGIDLVLPRLSPTIYYYKHERKDCGQITSPAAATQVSMDKLTKCKGARNLLNRIEPTLH
jgi:hypothetical protein